MLIVKGSIYREVSEQEAARYLRDGYTVVPPAKKGGKNGTHKA